VDRERYCVGCGRTRVLVAAILLCRDCYGDWLALASARPPQGDLGMRRAHA
jgi:hypothetical protein